MAARSTPERDRIWPATEHPHPSAHPLALSPNLELRAHRAPGRRVSSRVGADLRHRQDLRTRDQRSPWARDSGDPGSGSAPWRSTSTGSDARTATAPRPPRSCHRGRTRPSGHPAMSGGIRSQRRGRSATSFSGSPEARSKAPHGVRVASGAEVSERISASPAILLARFSSKP